MKIASLLFSSLLSLVNLSVLAFLIFYHIFKKNPFIPTMKNGIAVNKSLTYLEIALVILDVPYFIWGTVLCAVSIGGTIFSTIEEHVALLTSAICCFFFFFLFFYINFFQKKAGKKPIFFKWDRINSFVYFAFSVLVFSSCFFPVLIVSSIVFL